MLTSKLIVLVAMLAPTQTTPTYVKGPLVLTGLSVDPTSPANGWMYFNSTTKKFRCWIDTGWRDCSGIVGGQAQTVVDNGSTTAATFNFDASEDTATITCQDLNGCVGTMQEVSAFVTMTSTVCSSPQSLGPVTFPNVTDIFSAPARVTTYGLYPGECFGMRYITATNPRWVATSTLDLGAVSLPLSGGLMTGTMRSTTAVVSINAGGQIIGTANPADGYVHNGAIVANPVACDANESLFGALVNNTAKARIDCEGDVYGVQGNFSGQVTSNSANVLTSSHYVVSGVDFGGTATGSNGAANTPIFEFQTGSSGGTLTYGEVTIFYVGTFGVGTQTVDLTNTSGTALCTVSVPCDAGTIQTVGTRLTQSCNSALAANTKYQVRNKTMCTGGGVAYEAFAWTVSVP